MGFSISGILAILFIDKLEIIAPSSHLMISPYERYVDDIYLQTTNEKTADHFLHIINNVHSNLKFEIEKLEATPSGLSSSLLDFKVTISKDGNSSFKKPAKRTLIVHHQSDIPTKSKLNFIRNERKRIEDRCSSRISATQHLNTFDDILRLNGYPENSIEQIKRPQNPHRNPQSGNTERSYLKIPYIYEGHSHRITNIFRKENIPVRIAHKCYTLRKALYHTYTKWARDKCPISNTGLCLRRNIVYQLRCNSCHQQYIDSTTRFTHDRVKEHLNNENSRLLAVPQEGHASEEIEPT